MTPGRPLVVAHRAGNDLGRLERAARLGADVIEIDVHPYRGTLEVRHTKTLGPAPLLWDRWYPADGFAPVPALERVLGAVRDAPNRPVPMIDLKGADPRVPRMLRRALDDWPADRPLLVCGRVWRTLAALAGHPRMATVHSAGSPRQLARLLRRFPETGDALQGVSVHMRLLDPSTVAALRRRTPLVLSWPVNTAADGARLAGWGVTGLISDHPERLEIIPPTTETP